MEVSSALASASESWTNAVGNLCIGWLFCNNVEEDQQSSSYMDSLIVPTSPETPHVIRPGASGANATTELWEVILVASCPIIFIIFLCLCVVCLVMRSSERPNGQPLVQNIRHSSSSQIASILRQLPPPPKYDIAVTSVDAPPPLYTDIGKDMAPVRTTPSGARPVMSRSTPFANQHHLTTPTVQPLNIQYLYPPKYEESVSNSTTEKLPRVTPTIQHVIVEMDGSTSESQGMTR